MKKQYVIPMILMSVALAACGNKNESIDVNGTESELTQDQSQGQNANQDQDQTQNLGQNEIQDQNQNNSEDNADISQSDTLDNISDEDTENTEIPGKVTAFGDKTTMNNNVSGRELPIYCVDTEENKVALSFDAAWGAEDTQEILAILKEHDIHVTFFATGGWVESYPDDVKAVLEAGHDLGNHSANHKNMSELSDSDKEEELMSVHRKVKELTGYDMFLFRPPYGDYDNNVINVAKDCGYYAIQWDVDSLDWKNYGVDAIIETVTEHKNLGNGSIILCHNGADYTAQALDTLITNLESQGYEIVPISELIYQDSFHLNYEGRQIPD